MVTDNTRVGLEGWWWCTCGAGGWGSIGTGPGADWQNEPQQRTDHQLLSRHRAREKKYCKSQISRSRDYHTLHSPPHEAPHITTSLPTPLPQTPYTPKELPPSPPPKKKEEEEEENSPFVREITLSLGLLSIGSTQTSFSCRERKKV